MDVLLIKIGESAHAIKDLKFQLTPFLSSLALGNLFINMFQYLVPPYCQSALEIFCFLHIIILDKNFLIKLFLGSKSSSKQFGGDLVIVVVLKVTGVFLLGNVNLFTIPTSTDLNLFSFAINLRTVMPNFRIT